MKIDKKKVFNAVLFTFFILLLVYSLESGNWWSMIAYLCLWTAFVLWKGKDNIKMGMINAETKIFGKPLQKEYWAKGELKHHKVRFVWKKKNLKDQ